MSFAEKGAVGDIDPAFFVGYLHRLKATGTLKFEDAPIQRAIYFREGRVLFSSSNAPEDQLGAILVAGGKISQEQFDGLLASLEPKQSIAAALAQGGYVAQRDIGDAARKKVEQIVGSCCAQTTGRYEFEDGVLPKGALDLKLTTERVLINAFEALEPSGFLIRILKSPMAVLGSADVQPVEPELVRLKEALDGMSSLADIGGAVGMSLPAAEVRAAVLVVMGAATVVTSQIEEMALPDTGETTPGLMLDDAEPIEADTLAFGLSPAGGDVRFEADASGQNAPGSADATLVMGGGLDVSADATLVTDGLMTSSGIDLSPHIPSGGAKRDKASTQDLAAVKELLGSSGGPPRPPSASIPTKIWEPVLSTVSRPGSREKRGLAGFAGNPVVQKSAAALLLVGLAGVGWLVYSGGPTAPPTPTPTPAPSPLIPAPVTPAPAAPASAALTMPPAAATGPTSSPSSSVAPPVPAPSVSPSAAASTTAPAPVPTITPKPPVAPTPAPTPAVAQPSPRVPASAAAPAGASLAVAYQALKAGQLTESAVAAETVARSRSAEFSLQILVACSPQTIEKALLNDASTELFVLPATISGKACYRLMRGFFKTSDEASRVALPPYYAAEGAKPRAVSVKAVLR